MFSKLQFLNSSILPFLNSMVQGQCKPNAIEFIQIAEAPPELADES